MKRGTGMVREWCGEGAGRVGGRTQEKHLPSAVWSNRAKMMEERMMRVLKSYE